MQAPLTLLSLLLLGAQAGQHWTYSGKPPARRGAPPSGGQRPSLAFLGLARQTTHACVRFLCWGLPIVGSVSRGV